MKYKIIKRNDNNTEFFIEYTVSNNSNELLTTVKTCELSTILNNKYDIYYIVIDNNEINISGDEFNQLNYLPLINKKNDYDNEVINGSYIKIEQKNKVKLIIDNDTSNIKLVEGCEKVNNCLVLIKHKLNNYEFNTLKLVDININDINVVNFLGHHFKEIKLYYIDNDITEIFNDALFFYTPENSLSEPLHNIIHFDFLNTNLFNHDWFKTYDFIKLDKLPKIISGYC